MKNNLKALLIITTFILVAYSCSKLEPSVTNVDEVMDAPLEGLTASQNQLFLHGSEEFDEVYTTETGLGPLFVSTSCASCHAGDNRGHMFTILTRFGQSDSIGNSFLDFGGPQLQNHAITSHVAEQIPAGATATKLIAPIVSGTGFLELVSDADILALADANVSNPDGVRGRPNWNTIPSYATPFSNAITQGGKYICRFGRKASTYNLLQQSVQAFNQDIGITTTFLPENPYNYLQGIPPVATGEPEVTDNSLNGLVFYLQTLQTPLQRNQDDAEVIAGKQIFVNTGCESCHKQTLKTSFSYVNALSEKEFYPYTDLLLHDMGSALDDGYTEGTAKTSEWRTTPLWGLGLAEDAQGGNVFLLHDGRAHSIEEAILFHGGEAQVSKDRFTNLSQADKNALLKFLKSL